jgi:hypothetical protein
MAGFSLNMLNISLHFLLAYMASKEKLDAIPTFVYP